MNYKEQINSLVSNIDPRIVDFSKERRKAPLPTQVSSEFLINKEQGDWAEETLLRGINSNSKKYIAVRYGKNDNIVAGEEGFKKFYEAYQKELDEIGKRPDLLLFNKSDFEWDTTDISSFTREQLDSIVPKALCGIEVRSSAFLIEKYEECMTIKISNAIANATSIKQRILDEFDYLLKQKDPELYRIISSISPSNMHVQSFRCPSWKSSTQLATLSGLLKRLKEMITEISKRTYLSITPKIEDLMVVYNWVQRYNIPHFYVQVFFDKAFGISFDKILSLIGNSNLEGQEYFIEGDIKNQNKLTVKINAAKEVNILEKIVLPEHYSEMKQLERGRLLFFVRFKHSDSIINKEGFKKLFGFELE